MMAGWFGGRISQPVLTPLSSVDLVSEFGMICSLKRDFLTNYSKDICYFVREEGNK